MIFVVSVDDAVIARLKKGEDVFEVLVDCFKAVELKQGKDVDPKDLLAVEGVFSDARKGLRPKNLEKTFGTNDVVEIAKKIIKEGEMQLTQEYRKKLQDDKKKRVVQRIVQYASDVRTKAPVPPERVELAMEQARVHIDPFASDEDAFNKVVDSIRPILPLSFELKKFKVIVPAKNASKVYGMVTKYKKLKEEWLSNGDLSCEIEIPSGLIAEMYDVLNKATHGDIMINEVK